MSVPKAKASPVIKLTIDLPLGDLRNPGKLVRKFQYKAMVNGGYIVRAELQDPNSRMLNAMMENGYFEQVRTKPVDMIFQIKWGPDGSYPESATQEGVVHLLSVSAKGGAPDVNYLEFIGVDPPSWYLNAGDAAGTAFKGRISDVIKQVVNKYAPGVNVRVSQTKDSKENYWWMMRQDPKTFLGSLIDWSSGMTRSKTHWVVVPDNKDTLTFMEQADINSTQRAYYKHTDPNTGRDTLVDWSFLADNALSLSNTKIITHGLSAISGQYLDKITDKPEKKVYVKDQTTSAKKIAQVDQTQSYSKPPDSPPPQGRDTVAGWTSIGAVPELYSAGDVGMEYGDYIDGRARNLYLHLTNMLFRAKFRVLGHGEWSTCYGLGTDTIFVRWYTSDGNPRPYFLNGNWLVYGYEHVVDLNNWWTDLYCARFDYNSDAQKVGGG